MSKKFASWFLKLPAGSEKIKLAFNALGVGDEELKQDPSLLEEIDLVEFLAQRGHTIDRWNKDKTYFIKGIPFTRKGFKAFEALEPDYGLVEDENFWIFSEAELDEELAKAEWKIEEEVI